MSSTNLHRPFWISVILSLKEVTTSPKFIGGQSKKHTFFVFAYSKYSKHSSFPHIDVSASEVPAILKKLVSKEGTSEVAILKLSCQAGYVYVTSFRRTRNWWQGEKPATDFASFTRPAKCIFFQAIIHYVIFHAIISEFRARLPQNKIAQEQP